MTRTINTTYKINHVWAKLIRNKKIVNSVNEYCLAGDIDVKAAIDDVLKDYQAGDDYDYSTDSFNHYYEYSVNVIKDDAGYIINGFRLTDAMISTIFNAMESMCAYGMGVCEDEQDLDAYLKSKRSELSASAYAAFLLRSWRGSLVYCWDEWFDYDCIKEDRSALGYSDYIKNRFNTNKRDVYSICPDGAILTDTRIHGCDVTSFVDGAVDALDSLVMVLQALEYHKNKAAA